MQQVGEQNFSLESLQLAGADFLLQGAAFDAYQPCRPR